MKKILLISNMYPSAQHSYYGGFVKNITNTVVHKLNYELIKVVLTSEALNKNKGIAYFRFYIQALFRIICYKYNLIFIHYSSLSSLPVILMQSLLKSTKILVHVHGSDIYKAKGIFKIINKSIFKISDRIFTPSLLMKKQLLQEYSYIDDKKIVVSYSGGIDTGLFHPSEKNHTNKVVLGFVSTLIPEKGIINLLESLTHLYPKKKFRLKIAGNAPNEGILDEIESLSEFHDIKYYGILARVELVKFYNTLDLFIFPTLLPESLGLVGLEAMACGVPVIGSNIGALPEYIKNEYNGYLTETGNPTDLAKNIMNFCNLRPEEKMELGHNARSSAMKFSSDVVFKPVIDSINNLYK